MDPLATAAVHRARSALDLVVDGSSQRQKARAFVAMAGTMMTAPTPQTIGPLLAKSGDELVRKAAASILDGDTWGPDAELLAANWVASIAPQSALDQIALFARVLPPRTGRAMVAVGAVGDLVDEGGIKPVRELNLTPDDLVWQKPAALVCMTSELARATGAAGRNLFESELQAAVLRASNTAVVGMLSTGATPVAGTGDALGDLRAGLAASVPSSGYVVLASAAVVADLGTRGEVRGDLGVRGGTFAPGIEVVPVEGMAEMLIIPASRIALIDEGLRVSSASHASLDFRDSPTDPPELTNLWQSDTLAILAERRFGLAAGSPAVVVAAA